MTEQKSKGIESTIFLKWSDWDKFDSVGVQVYDAELAINIGKHKTGEVFGWASIDFNTSTLTLGISENSTEEYDISLVVGNRKQRDDNHED